MPYYEPLISFSFFSNSQTWRFGNFLQCVYNEISFFNYRVNRIYRLYKRDTSIMFSLLLAFNQMNGSFCNIFFQFYSKKKFRYKYNLVNSTQNNGSKFTAVTSCGYILQCTLWNLALVLWQLLEHTFVLIRETPLVDRLFFVDWWFFFYCRSGRNRKWQGNVHLRWHWTNHPSLVWTSHFPLVLLKSVNYQAMSTLKLWKLDIVLSKKKKTMRAQLMEKHTFFRAHNKVRTRAEPVCEKYYNYIRLIYLF